VALFRSKEIDQIEAVKIKLDAARAAVATAEVTMHSLALDVALSSDEHVFRDAMADLRDARDRAEVLAHALQVAEQREVDRLAAARASLRSSQNKAVRQHVSSLIKAALEYQVSIDNQAAAFRRMVRAGESITRLLPRDDGDRSGFANAVSPAELTKACLIYLGKYAARPSFPGDPISVPGAHHMPAPLPPGINYAYQVPPLAEGLKTLLLRQFERLTGRAAPPAPDPTRLDAMEPQPEPPPAPAVRLDAGMIAVEGPEAVRQALIERGLMDALAARKAAPVAEPVVEPEPGHIPDEPAADELDAVHVDEPGEEPPAQITKPARRGSAVAALFGD
jgi:hypothetical protein